MAKSTTSSKGHFGQQDSKEPRLPQSQNGAKLTASLPRLTGLLRSQTESTANTKGTSLRLRLLQTVLPVVLIPLMLAGMVGYRVVAQRTEERIQEQLKNQAMLTSEGTTAVLDDLLDLPQSIATNPLVVNEALAGSEQVEAEGLDQRPIAELEAEYASSKLLRRHKRLNDYLKETSEAAEISEISITESHGLNVAYSQPTTDFVQYDEDWWKNGKQNGLWIGAPDFNYAAKGFTIEVAQAIKDQATGNFVGVVRVVLPARKFSLLAQYLQRTGIANSQRVQLIDGADLKVIDTFSPQGFRKSREIIGGKPLEQVVSTLIKTIQQREDPQQVLQVLKDNPSIKNLSIAFSDKTATVVSFNDGDRQYKVASIPLTQWVAVSSMNKADISAAGRDSLIFFALTTLLLAGITAGLILWLARQLSTPLGSLADQAQRVAAGDFDVAVTPSGTTETKTLTQSFNQLVVQVKDLLQRQESETQKAQLFAEITGSSATDLADLKPILNQCLPKAQTLLNADRLLFYPIKADQATQLATEVFSPELSASLTDPAITDCIPPELRNVDAEGPAIAIDNVETAGLAPKHRVSLNHLNAQATLTVPVFNEESLFGFLIAHRREPQAWQPADVQFITQLAAQLKLVIDRATALKKIQETQQVAQVLTAETQQQSVELSRQKEQISQQSESQRRQKEQLQQQVTDLIADIQGVFQGDLTVRAQVAEGDLKTVADVFNLTVAKLQELVTQIKQSTFQVNTFLNQNEEMVAQLASSTALQTQEADRTLNTVQSMIGAMDTIAENARQAAATAHTVAATAEASEKAMNVTTERILRLNGVCSSTVRQIENFGGSTRHIAQVTAMIREIATEIDLLSTQAKEEITDLEGHPLETKTEEINKLAKRAISETRLIDTFLRTIQTKMVQIAETIDQISSQTTESTQLIRDSKQNLEEVAAVSRKFNHLAQSISTATLSQSQISQSVANLVQEVAGLSEQTTTFSHKMERALHETVETAQELQNSVSRFKV